MAQKILLVEDDSYIRSIYAEVLQEAGYQVDIAEDGVLGLQKIRKGTYDLILLDILMPNMDGPGVLEALEKDPTQSSHAPIILLSNIAKDPMMQGGMTKGAAGYIVKTDINPGQLIDYVKKFLKPN